MKIRLAWTLLLLVILPTAVLSFMAHRALQSREEAMTRQRELAASRMVRAAEDRIRARLDDELEHVRVAMFDCFARGGDVADIEATAVRLGSSHVLIRQVFLFMNPWGFVFPESEGRPVAPPGDAGREGSTGSVTRVETGSRAAPAVGSGRPGRVVSARKAEQLTGILRRDIASARSVAGRLGFCLEGDVYCFAPLGEKKGLYAGFEVQEAELWKVVTGTVEALSGAEIVLRAEPSAGASAVPADRLLAAVTLPPPLEFVKVSAERADAPAAGAAARTRLYGWAVALMAFGIVAGAGVVLLSAAAEVRRVRSRSDFIVGISHDLRTPIASLKVLAESLFLGHVTDPAQQKKFLGTLLREAERLNQFIERVLFLVRFEQDALAYHVRPLDLAAIVGAAVEAFRARTGPAGNAPSGGSGSAAGPGHVRLDFAAGRVPPVRGDEAAITQVVVNLLDNAVKYSRVRPAEGGGGPRPVRVTVDTVARARGRIWGRRSREWVRVSVADEGIGIPRGEQKKIFRKFYRVAGSAGANVAGLGLGLALCRRVVREHGGWIEVESREGQGSTFTFGLPADARAGGEADSAA